MSMCIDLAIYIRRCATIAINVSVLIDTQNICLRDRDQRAD
jgi:hypothetical protein